MVPRIAMGNNLMFGFPSQLVTKLRYADTYALVCTSGAIAKNVFNMNSIFDPDSTGIGHQPAYRDTYATLYDQYAVISSNIKVTFVSLAANTGVHAGLTMDDDSTTTTTVTTLIEQNFGKTTLLAPISGGLSCKTLTASFDCKKHLGIDPYTSEQYKSSQGSNPNETFCAVAWASPCDGSSTVTVQALVEIEYTVLFSELATIIGS